MLSSKELNKNIRDMTMSEIEIYVEQLKETIYHQAETLQYISTSLSNVEKDLKHFNGISNNSNNISKNIEENINKNNIDEIIEYNEKYKEEENFYEENNDGPYILAFYYKADNKKEKAIFGKNNIFTIESIEPNLFDELITHTEYQPAYYFDEKPTNTLQLWENFSKIISELTIYSRIKSFDLEDILLYKNDGTYERLNF